MADRRTTNARGRNQVNRKNSRSAYVQGNAIRNPQEIPERRGNRRQAPRKKTNAESERRAAAREAREAREALRQIERNRAKAEGITKGFIIFLSVICIALLPVTIRYLKLKSQITTIKKEVAFLESELTDLKEENDAYYSQVTNNVDMSKIKKIAIGRLGMKYPTDDQTETYQTARSSYVRQYQDLPDSK